MPARRCARMPRRWARRPAPVSPRRWPAPRWRFPRSPPPPRSRWPRRLPGISGRDSSSSISIRLRPPPSRTARSLVDAAGGNYVEAAVMGSVPPYGLKVPIILGGSKREELARLLAPADMRMEIGVAAIGVASAVKMCRSIMIKGSGSADGRMPVDRPALRRRGPGTGLARGNLSGHGLAEGGGLSGFARRCSTAAAVRPKCVKSRARWRRSECKRSWPRPRPGVRTGWPTW